MSDPAGAHTKRDLKKDLAAYRAPRGRFEVVDLPPQRYLAIDGSGAPAGEAFTGAIAALYPVAYALKFASKRELGRDYVVPPLEGLWWADDMATFTTRRDKARWRWTLLILVPEWVDDALVEAALAAGAAKSPASRAVRAVTLAEGTCVQTLHVGSFDDEGPVLARMHDEFLPAQGLRMTGRHHEIYLSDFRRVEPAKLRTILRQPVLPVGAAAPPGE
ncbi:GyrI-like domain-containing protein [Microbacterium hominis]|uniref:GyrI-like domain-containing protein n=1 Tax=Microbacterium hominis TaxID=162426 RepID=A0A7D4U3L0_9MICO|nr:GyrI-like domain-containing protein [Microbacterium hominis]QKJ18725.1 GyrI-like domain-containing protein [Microbacterium hominis]